MSSQKPTAKTTGETLAEIARKHLHIETLETQRADRLDFHDVSVWGVRDALTAAFDAGQEHAQRRAAKHSAAMDEVLAAAQALLNAHDNQMVTSVEWRRLRRAAKAAR
jgi:hypothetical protein